jgi:hypothetical protein
MGESDTSRTSFSFGNLCDLVFCVFICICACFVFVSAYAFAFVLVFVFVLISFFVCLFYFCVNKAR